MVLLTHAELQLALIVRRRTEQVEVATVSTRMWEDWTGQSERTRDNAIRGLREKQLLEVDGRGDDARFSVDLRGWSHYVRHAPATKGRTAGRAESKPELVRKPMHEDCQERGCAVSNGRAVMQNAVHQIATAPPQVVSSEHQAAEVVTAPPVPSPASHSGGGDRQVTQEQGAAGWFQTLAALRAAFATIGIRFLFSLLSVVLASFPDVTDSELATAVGFAWRAKKRYQEGEGLFLSTVPDALRAMREHASSLVAPPIAQPVAQPPPLEPETSGSPWMRVRLRLKAAISPRAYQDWVERTAFESFDVVARVMRVRVPDQVTADWLTQEYGEELLAAAVAEKLGAVKFLYLVGVAP
jgi:hypothetical protein